MILWISETLKSLIIYISDFAEYTFIAIFSLNFYFLIGIIFHKIKTKSFLLSCELNVFYSFSRHGRFSLEDLCDNDTKIKNCAVKKRSIIFITILTFFSLIGIFSHTPLVKFSPRKTVMLFGFILYVCWSYYCISLIADHSKAFPFFFNPFARSRFLKNYRSAIGVTYVSERFDPVEENVREILSIILKLNCDFFSQKKIKSKNRWVEQYIHNILYDMVQKDTISPETAECMFEKFETKIKEYMQ